MRVTLQLRISCRQIPCSLENKLRVTFFDLFQSPYLGTVAIWLLLSPLLWELWSSQSGSSSLLKQHNWEATLPRQSSESKWKENKACRFSITWQGGSFLAWLFCKRTSTKSQKLSYSFLLCRCWSPSVQITSPLPDQCACLCKDLLSLAAHLSGI